MNKLFDKTFIKFILVGVINTLVGSVVMFLLYNLAGCSYWVSSFANYVIGGVCSFFLNKHYTFQNKDHSWSQVGKFALTVIVCYIISYGLAKPLALKLLSGYPSRIQENVALVIGMGLYLALNYVGQKFFAFKKTTN